MRVYVMEHAPSVGRPKLIADHIEGMTPFWAHRMVSSIKGKTCRDFAKSRTTESMARHELETLRAAVRYFHKEYGLDPLPAFTMPEKPGNRARWLTRQEAAQLIRAALGWHHGKDGETFRLPKELRSPHLARFILIGLYSGTRSGAILGLSWIPSVDSGWIDLGAGVMHRSGAAQRKSKKSQPPVKLSPRLAAHLRRWQVMDRGIKKVINWNNSSVQSVKKSFRTARINAKLDQEVIPHTLRHTAATWLMQKGVEHQKAAGFLGMTQEVLERVYGHHHPDFQSQAADAIGRS